MALTQAAMDRLARQVFLPTMLLLDYAMFQYLVTVYYKRRREFRVMQLFLGSLLGFMTLLMFADADKTTMQSLNDVSETCSQLTFLIQITIIGYAVQKKVRVKSIRYFTYAAELLILADWINVAMVFAGLFNVEFGDEFHLYNNFLESFTLTFVLIFRFYYLSMSKGVRVVLRERRIEFLAYLLVVTHEYLFMVLEYATGVSWEYVQGIYMRTMIMWCIVLNVLNKLSLNSRSNAVRNPPQMSVATVVHDSEDLDDAGKLSSVIPQSGPSSHHSTGIGSSAKMSVGDTPSASSLRSAPRLPNGDF